MLESVTEELENVDIDDDDEEEEEEIPAPDPKLLKSQFRLFAKFGDTAADGNTIKARFRSWSAMRIIIYIGLGHSLTILAVRTL